MLYDKSPTPLHLSQTLSLNVKNQHLLLISRLCWTKKKILHYFVVIMLLLVAVSDAKKNILFLVSDDMRPEITAFLGPDFPSPVHPKMHTPNLDALAAKSLLLKRAYVQQAVS